MNKRICDICDKKEANNSFRIQQEKEVASYSLGFLIPKKEWVEIDICDECFEKMKTIKDYKKLMDRIEDEAIVGWTKMYDGDFDKQCIYLDGVTAACRGIDPKHQFKINT
jgi:hypothetical protein